MSLRILSISIAFLFFFTFTNCKEDYVNKENIYKCDSFHYDSLYIFEYAHNAFDIGIGDFNDIKHEVERYKKYTDYRLKYAFSVNDIFYSPDCLKLFSFVIFGVTLKKDAKWPSDYDQFAGRCVIGYRDDTCQKWTLYPYNKIILSGAPSLDTLVRDLKKYYFDELKYQRNYFDTSESSPSVSIPYQYNIDDEGYWEKSPDWRKDYSIYDSIYPFQFIKSNPYYDRLYRLGYRYYSDRISPPQHIYDETNSLYKKGTLKWNAHLWSNLLEGEVTEELYKEKYDSLEVEYVKQYFDSTFTREDIIKKGLDISTLKEELESFKYTDSLLNYYRCK